MCGIIAAASNRNVGGLLVEGLHKMEYRGYDSAGLALHLKSNIAHIRTLGKVSLLEEKLKVEEPDSTLGIAHTRWATHGEPSEKNAHPHKFSHKKGLPIFFRNRLRSNWTPFRLLFKPRKQHT